MSFKEQYDKLVKITSQPDWDCTPDAMRLGCKTISKDIWEEFILSLYNKVREDLPFLSDPFPSADSDGGLYLRWFMNDIRFDLEIISEEYHWCTKINGLYDRHICYDVYSFIEKLKKVYL